MFSFQIPVVGRIVCYCYVCYDSQFSEYLGLPDIKNIDTQTQLAAAMEASTQT